MRSPFRSKSSLVMKQPPLSFPTIQRPLPLPVAPFQGRARTPSAYEGSMYRDHAGIGRRIAKGTVMPAATIIVDVNHLLNDQKATMVVEKVSDYPYAYLALKEAIHRGSTVSVHVRNPTVATWFARCAASY